jgi:nuclear pore complex protein Nup107
MDVDGDTSAFSGAVRRRLWKRTVIACALDDALPPAERVLYAALAPAPATAAVLGAAARTWPDRMWAAVALALEARLAGALRRVRAESWETDADADALGAARERERRRADGAPPDSDALEDQAEDGAWEAEWVETMRTFETLKPEEGYACMRVRGGCSR